MESLRGRAAAIRLVVLDVDGVLTDGRLHLGAAGDEIKTFHTRDGAGLKALIKAGIRVAVISGRNSPAVDRRMAELGIDEVHQGIADKLPVFEALLSRHSIPADAVASMGDDVADLPLLTRSALAVCPADAHSQAIEACHWRTALCGGRGAVRELCDLILDARSGSPSDASA